VQNGGTVGYIGTERPEIYSREEHHDMPHVITDDCVACGACEAECPVEAISEGDDKYLIKADICTDCGSCVEVCPNDAIIPGE
jgi:ferredoxin